MDEHIRVAELVSRFDEGWQVFYSADAAFSSFYQGPCLYFHLRTISVLRRLLSQSNSGYRAVCESEEFMELLYATLTAWGMNRMGRKGPKLQEFERFRETLRAQTLISSLNALQGSILAEVDDLEELRGSVEKAFEYLKTSNGLMKNTRALVGVSKTLHHLLPDLLIPVDRGYTIALLSHVYEDKFRPSQQGDSFGNYWKCIRFSHFVAREKGLSQVPADPTCPMNTSVPKLIDNAIVGLRHLLIPGNRRVEEE